MVDDGAIHQTGKSVRMYQLSQVWWKLEAQPDKGRSMDKVWSQRREQNSQEIFLWNVVTCQEVRKLRDRKSQGHTLKPYNIKGHECWGGGQQEEVLDKGLTNNAKKKNPLKKKTGKLEKSHAQT